VPRKANFSPSHHRYLGFLWSGRRDSNPRPSPWQGDCFRPSSPVESLGCVSVHQVSSESSSDPACCRPVYYEVVRWYHDTMTKNLTVRLPDDVAADAEALARVEGKSLNETVKQSLIEAVERRRNNPKFKARLAKIIEEDRELLERLAK